MTYAQLRAFHAVSRHGGFSKAAQALGLTQPAISDQVKRLEQSNDVLLYERDGKQVALTPEGEALFGLTKQFFEIEEQIREHLSVSRAAVDGTLRIVVDAAHHLSDQLTRFRERHPSVFISLRTGNTEEVLSEIRAFNADIGVIGAIAPSADLETIDLGATPIIAFSARDYLPTGSSPMTLKALARQRLVFREPGSRTRQRVETEARRQKVALTPSMEVEGREALREVVASGNGIGFISESEFGNDPRLVKIALEGVDISMAETMVYLSQRKDVRMIRAFLSSIADM